ncbi:hypothetical protein [Rhodococcoides kyotonense]|uniref:Cyclase n=1 Tax=Rhodococcoides kyotonense TaxID=398843 RepID=A0A239LG90_9NOCA|nr:hypothetical protein [Rhodococcus kyotonensis]SNT29491.1 hypothetical protein SAMN05421642_11339 [Rhodococcus kyotonensis]
MTTLITRHRVRDYEQWHNAFAGHQDNRRAHGATGHRIYRDGNDITVLTHFPDRRSVDEFLADPALANVVAVAGFVDPPVTVICDDADSQTY